jgi:hypothetical protein
VLIFDQNGSVTLRKGEMVMERIQNATLPEELLAALFWRLGRLGAAAFDEEEIKR